MVGHDGVRRFHFPANMPMKPKFTPKDIPKTFIRTGRPERTPGPSEIGFFANMIGRNAEPDETYILNDPVELIRQANANAIGAKESFINGHVALIEGLFLTSLMHHVILTSALTLYTDLTAWLACRVFGKRREMVRRFRAVGA